MGLGGIIAGAFGGAAGQAVDVADQEIKRRGQIDLLKVQAEIERERDARRQELAKDLEMWKTDTSPGGFATREAGVAAARETAVGTARGDAQVKTAEKLGPVQATNAGLVADAQAEAERRNVEKLGSSKEYLSALKKIAVAKDAPDSPAAAAQADLFRLQAARLRQLNGVRDALAKETDPEKRDQLLQQIDDLDGKSLSRAEKQKIVAANNVAISKLASSMATMEPEQQAETQALITSMRQQNESLLGPAGKSGPPPMSEADKVKAQDDARRAVKLGRISLTEANARLKAAGVPLIQGEAPARGAPEGTW